MDVSSFNYVIDTFFLLFAAVLILFMVPGFAMLEAGLVRSKNVSAVLTGNVMLSMRLRRLFFCCGVITSCLVEAAFF